MRSKQHLKIKDCSVCKVFFPNTNEFFQRRRGNHLRGECRKCRNEYIKEWRTKLKENHPQKYRDYNRNNNLKRSRGITLDKYNIMLKEQNEKCAICKSSTNGNWDNFFVDHDHKTNKNRGLLCSRCNFALGYIEEDLERIERAKIYLRKHCVEDYSI